MVSSGFGLIEGDYKCVWGRPNHPSNANRTTRYEWYPQHTPRVAQEDQDLLISLRSQLASPEGSPDQTDEEKRNKRQPRSQNPRRPLKDAAVPAEPREKYIRAMSWWLTGRCAHIHRAPVLLRGEATGMGPSAYADGGGWMERARPEKFPLRCSVNIVPPTHQ